MPDIKNMLDAARYKEEITNFGKEFARKHMPNYDSEWLIIAVNPRRQEDREDKVTQLSLNEGIFTKLSPRSLIRQYVFENGEYRERTVAEIEAGEPKTEAKKVISVNCLNHIDYFRMDYDGKEHADGHAVGQGRQIDMLWDGAKFEPIAKSDHLVTIT
jgi:hypothetical protein